MRGLVRRYPLGLEPLMRGTTSAWVAALIGLSSGGCTYRAWYAGFQERQRQECYELADRSEIDRCLERVSAATYDDYREERERTGRPGE